MPRDRHERSAEVTDVRGDTPRPSSVYGKPEAISEELRFGCDSCGERVFLPAVAVERIDRR